MNAGQILVELDSANQQWMLTDAKMRFAAARRARATMRSKRQVEREQTLVNQASPRKDGPMICRRERRRWRTDQGLRRGAVSEIDTLKINLNYMTTVSPVSTLLNRPPEVGEVLSKPTAPPVT